MGVQLNIKDAETVRLARSLADETGKSVTEAIRLALRQAHADREREVAERKADIRRAVQAIRDCLPPEILAKSSRELMNDLYGEDGLPR